MPFKRFYCTSKGRWGTVDTFLHLQPLLLYFKSKQAQNLLHKKATAIITIYKCYIKNHLSPAWATVVARQFWSAITPERIGLEGQWIHSLDAGTSKASNALDTNVPLYLKFQRKNNICAFAVVIFWQFSNQLQKPVPRIPFNPSD